MFSVLYFIFLILRATFLGIALIRLLPYSWWSLTTERMVFKG